MALKLSAVVARYRQDDALPALDGLSLEVGASGCLAIVGPSGSGKSTLGRVMNGLLRPASGTVELDGVELRRMATLAGVRRRVGLLMQQPDNQLFGVTVGEDIRFGPLQAGLDHQTCMDRMSEAMDAVGLERATFVARSPFSLSGGERRRVALAGLLAMQPQHLVLDEPVAGLDPAGRDSIEHVITRLAGELSVVLLTADLPLALRLADRLVLLEAGRVLFEGAPPEAVADRQRLARLRLVVPPQVELLEALRCRGLTVPSVPDLRPSTVVAAVAAAFERSGASC